MNSRSKKLLLFQRSLIWFLYLFSGFILYSKKGYLFSIFMSFAKVIYPLSIFWLQIRIKKIGKFLPIDSTMKTSELWFSLLPVLASMITVILCLLNTIFYITDNFI